MTAEATKEYAVLWARPESRNAAVTTPTASAKIPMTKYLFSSSPLGAGSSDLEDGGESGRIISSADLEATVVTPPERPLAVDGEGLSASNGPANRAGTGKSANVDLGLQNPGGLRRSHRGA